jgi:hypothetical protein
MCVRDTVDEAVILFPPLVLLDENYPGMNASSLAHMNILSDLSNDDEDCVA